ncbi:MAG: outer membrane lipoprotein carrier protein LolA [Xanthomonadales bacterium]|nr:outer membrane lipoprotein carrier protein LolA [Xanthomonadales bacterium]
MMRVLALLGLLLLAAAPLPAASELAEVAARIEQPQVLRGRFEQDKQVAGFRKPLHSSGRFVLARARGVLWSTEQPFASQLVLTGASLSVESGGSTRNIDAADEPALAAIHAVLFDLLGGDIAKLQANFTIVAQLLDADRWRLQLQPKPGLFAQAFTRIELEGARHVERVQLFEVNGDRTEIAFREFDQAAELTADEAARLAQ